MRPKRFESPHRPAHGVTPGALVMLACLLVAACASDPAPRPLATGFAAETGVADPYADGKRHLDARRYDLAAQRFGQALARDRRSLDALNGLAIAYTRLGRFESAQSQFERALQIDPTSALTLNNYGWSLIEQGRLREAKAFLDLARRHATAAEAPVIAANLENLGRARPSALLAALEEGPQAPRGPHRLVRVDDNAYRLETTAEPLETPLPPGSAREAPRAPSALQQDPTAIGSRKRQARPDAPSAPLLAAEAVDAAGTAPAAAVPAPPAGPEPGVPLESRSGGGPIQLWPSLAPEAGASPIRAGDD
jgi:type IV pilus assembly protein PilF